MRISLGCWVLALALAMGCDGTVSEAPPTPTADASSPDDGGPVSRSDGGSSGPDGARPVPDADMPPPGSTVPMFVAQGLMGRSTISCDDGRTWVADRAFDSDGDALVCGRTDPAVCFEGSCTYQRDGECITSDGCDCGHHTGFGKGVVYGDGWFVATWGWGHSGTVRRSRNGVDWEETLSESMGGAWVSFGGIAYGNGTFVLAARTPYFSADGSSWTEGQEADFRGPGGEVVWSVRDFNFANGRFIASASPPEDVLITDDGDSWRRPTDRPEACVQNVSGAGGIAHGNGVTVSVGGDGRLCTSADGGDIWTEHAAGVGSEGIYSRSVIWTGTEFMVWGSGADFDTRVYRSTDGAAWTDTVTDPPRIRIGPVARSEATGTLVTSSNIWSAYADQQFYRSTDGVTWEALPAGAFNASHNIFEIAFGYGEPSATCPGTP